MVEHITQSVIFLPQFVGHFKIWNIHFSSRSMFQNAHQNLFSFISHNICHVPQEKKIRENKIIFTNVFSLMVM
jgi:hypothetical protein